MKLAQGFKLTLATALVALVAACTGPDKSTATSCNGAETPTSRLFLQQISSDSAIIKWRGEAGAVCVGEQPDQLSTRVAAVDEAGHKMAVVTGLKPDTRYYYSVGAAAQGPAGQSFHTAPKAGTVPGDGNTHIWILGDSGTASMLDEHGKQIFPDAALAVKAGFLKYNQQQAGNEPLDLLLLLGDNAYGAGTDQEWQQGFFEIYPEILRTVAVWPTIGNHEMGFGGIDICPYQQIPGCDQGPVVQWHAGASNSADAASYDSDGDGPDGTGLPYLNMFSLPTRAEMGGAASGTEQYYSVNYGNVHLVSLDSQLANVDVDQRRAMRDWLIDDLGANDQAWTIVIFHHPAYSKGQGHDSDSEQREIDMRQTFAPVFEDYGVDVVYNGHSHSYERSWYIGGHYGLSNTFDARLYAELDAAGNPTFGQNADPYPQVSATSGADDKAVYTVAGNSGMVFWYPTCAEGAFIECTAPDWLLHPAHRSFDDSIDGHRPHGIVRMGSVVVDATATSLTSRLVDVNGEVLDYFVITR